MGERGHTLHVLDGHVGDALATLGHRIAVLGHNERWTTFVPIDASPFDSKNASKILVRPLIHLWFDDDAGISVDVYASGTFLGQMSLPSDDADVTEADLDFSNKLEELDVLTR